MREIEKVIDQVKTKDPNQPEFHQAVTEVLTSLEPAIAKHPEFMANHILHRLVEPERIVMFKVAWMDDNKKININRGFRVQFNSAIGPYKGGLRFHPSVNLSILKFLGFEQVFKNSLTGLAMGGAKGGSDFDPKGKSQEEIMRFCQAFMIELFRFIGADVDVPAGDIGVGGREIGYMFGQYRKITNSYTGVLTGKGLDYGGSFIRPEATGYGATYFAEEMLVARKQTIKGKVVAISGSGNVAQYAVQKCNQLGAKVVTLSDSDGTIYDPEGITGKKYDFFMELKQVREGRIKEYADEFGVEFMAKKRPWSIKCDIAMPCATQNEIEKKDAEMLINNGVLAVVEGANMPSSIEATQLFLDAGVSFGPGKAANAGGVACSGLEMAQNSMHMRWSPDEVDQRLKEIMKNIHKSAYETATLYDPKPRKDGVRNYVIGANIAGFLKVAHAMIAQGIV
ncbi:MAG: NADP-specific glutamate dehydrogenase [Candidatus Lokiarchaeota archaeon]|nr:NADP-specific glutamate dehydrogenase [Candidatus Lokiarchaeota archaeon]